MEVGDMKLMVRLLLVLCITAGLGACTSARLNQFDKFSKAGHAYSDTMIDLVTEVGKVSIDVDSQTLKSARRDITNRKMRKKEILKNTKDIQQQLKILSEIRQHLFLLKKYFISLGQLTNSEVDSEISKNASGLVSSIEGLSPSLQGKKIGDFNVSNFVEAATKISVRHFRKKVLEEHFSEKRVSTIERALETQKALLTALVEKLKADQKTLLAARQTYDIVLPYTDSVPLPYGWATARKEVLSNQIFLCDQISLVSAKNAASTASNLKATFLAIVSEDNGDPDFSSVFSDIAEILDLVELVKSK